ncbi:MAG: alanine racemase [Ruminococcaceae bacterium]|nr:alanine racemase [Oscillospiraceae bacterium]
MNSFWKRLWTEINLDNLIYNYNSIKSYLASDVELCCVVKANAYGHHAPRVAKALEQAGARWFAVSNIEEAVQLRNEGLRGSIVILGYTPPECAKKLSELNISQCVYSLEYAKQLSYHASLSAAKVNVHIKIDTGMGRLGFLYDDESAVDDIALACKLDGIVPEGIFTHFAVSDCGEAGKAFSNEQHFRFLEIIKDLDSKGIVFKYKHCANSAATVDYPEFGMNMVRVGIILYGLMPSSDTFNHPNIKPVMSLKTVVSHVKTVEAGATVSYGSDFVAPKKMKIATVPMGYADGFLRSNAKHGIALDVKGKRAPIIGRICMDQLMLDVTDIPDVQMGDEVTVFGDSSCINTADTIAAANGTINYEIVCSVGKRVPRVFIRNGCVDGIHLGILDTTVN